MAPGQDCFFEKSEGCCGVGRRADGSGEWALATSGPRRGGECTDFVAAQEVGPGPRARICRSEGWSELIELLHPLREGLAVAGSCRLGRGGGRGDAR